MKILYIVRHAKSSWDHHGVPDFDRPLNDRGRRDAPRMAKRMRERDIHVNVMLSSPANRALSTCRYFAEALEYPVNQILTDRNLYHADEDEILSVIRQVRDDCNTLMVFGHNPGITDLVNLLDEKKKIVTSNVPTCGVTGFSFDLATWKDVDFRKAVLLFYDFPKSGKT